TEVIMVSQELFMSATASQSPTAARSVVAALLPIMAAVFVAFLITGLAMPVLPLHVHEGLGLGTFVVGLVAGCQFTAALLSRFWSGSYADSRGGKRAVVAGCCSRWRRGCSIGCRFVLSARQSRQLRFCLRG